MLYILNGHEPVIERRPERWAMFFQDADKRRVAFSEIDSVDGAITVSTVFLASDHNFGEGPPILFETLVSGGDDEEMYRCSTWKQAEQQHKDIVKKIKFTH